MVQTIHEASVADVDEAVRCGAAAAADPAWRDLPAHERARHLHRIADGIERAAEYLARLQSRDTGKTLRETKRCLKRIIARQIFRALQQHHPATQTPEPLDPT